MTALEEYSRLESGGLWKPQADAQRREVTVSFGKATLVIADGAGRPLAHWSLPAVARLNPGGRPALFAPDADASETLEISDDLMIEAMEKVRATVKSRRARPGRLRALGVVGVIAAVAGLGLFWVPGALVGEAENVVPAVKRAEIGAQLLGHIQRVTGQTCRSRLGTAALEQLYTRALGQDAGGRAFVVPGGPDRAVYLPGGLIVMNRDLIEDTEDPAVVAGHIIAAAAQAHVQDPLGALLSHAGVGTTVTLLTTGEIGDAPLRAYAEALFAAPPPAASDETLLALFADGQVPSTPYAYAVDITGESTLGLIEADPLRGQSPQLLSDGDWISLQGICS